MKADSITRGERLVMVYHRGFTIKEIVGFMRKENKDVFKP
jgi:hypothetical protein